MIKTALICKKYNEVRYFIKDKSTKYSKCVSIKQFQKCSFPLDISEGTRLKVNAELIRKAYRFSPLENILNLNLAHRAGQETLTMFLLSQGVYQIP